MSDEDDEKQEILDDLADLARVLKVLGKNADSLTCTRAAIWIAGTKPAPEERAIDVLDKAIMALSAHYAPQDVVATREGLNGWNGAVGYCIGTLRVMQEQRREPQNGDQTA